MRRLDIYLLEQGLFQSRNKAAEAIRAGWVRVDDRIVTKPSFRVAKEANICLEGISHYVSRSAQKLLGYLREYPFQIEGKYCLDIGSSTGGFTQVLLEEGALGVDAVDVGSDQLHPILRADKRVRSFEQTDIRDFDAGVRYSLIVSDLSFISLRYILPSISRLAKRGADVVLLFKPQFEVGKEAKRNRRGVVEDSKAISEAMARFEAQSSSLGLEFLRKMPSLLAGKEGNQEWIYHFRTPN